MATIIADIQHKNASTAVWAATNHVLKMAERGYDTDEKKWKTGDGVTAWNALEFDEDKLLRVAKAQTNQGSIDASSNPNYPAANNGHTYTISVAGKIGGASGVSVEAGDRIVAIADNAGGTQAAVGSSWVIVQANLVGALLAANNLSEVNPATARTNLGIPTLLDSILYGNESGQFGFLQSRLFKDKQTIFFRATASSVGNNSLYTVPAGFKFIPVQVGILNSAGATNAYYFQVYDGVNYQRFPLSFAASQTLTSTSTSTGFGLGGMFLNAGEQLIVNMTQNASVFWVRGILVPDTTPIVIFKQRTALTANTPVTIYTCPPNKKAILLGFVSTGLLNQGSAPMMNVSGGSLSVEQYLVKSGETPTATLNKIQFNVLANNAANAAQFLGFLDAGDSYQIQTLQTIGADAFFMSGAFLEVDA